MDDANIINFPKLCECGCGQVTAIVRRTQTNQGAVAGQPRRFVNGGHARRMQQRPPKETDEGIVIYLTRGYECLVSPVDADLATLNWHASDKKGGLYAVRTSNNSYVIRMHKIILERMLGRLLNPDEFSDHKDGNTLDNRRENLRAATMQQSAQNRSIFKNNTSGYKGVSYIKAKRCWAAKISVAGRAITVGCFDTPEEASEAYERAATELFGEWKREA